MPLARCATPRCDRPVHSRGLCGTCYQRERAAGRLPRVRRKMRDRTLPIGVTFPKMLVETPGPLATPCLLWPGQTFRTGYGKITVDGKTRMTHRLAWEISRGPIPEGFQLNHLCDIRRCCNAVHLYVGTQRDNTYDRLAREAS